MAIKAIETPYKGYRFRSRHEARWAVCLSALGVKWEYEKEGYDLDGVWYLPDFWLPDHKIWVEVKPAINDATGEEEEKIVRLARATGRICVIVGEFLTQSLRYTPDSGATEPWMLPAPLDVLRGGIDQMFPEEPKYPAYPGWYEIMCAVCGDPYVHLKSCEIVPCDFSYTTAGLSFWCERGCTYDLLIGNHKGLGFAQIANAKIATDSLVEFLTQGNDNLIAEAFDKAKSARFEHGESPE